MFIIIWGLQKKGGKRKILLWEKQCILRAFSWEENQHTFFVAWLFVRFLGFVFFYHFIVKIFKHRKVERLEELYSAYIPTTLPLYLLYHIFTCTSIFLSILQSILFLMHFKVSCRHQHTFPSYISMDIINNSGCILINKIFIICINEIHTIYSELQRRTQRIREVKCLIKSGTRGNHTDDGLGEVDTCTERPR